MKTTTTIVIDALTESFYAVREMTQEEVQANIGTLFRGAQDSDQNIRYIETDHEGMVSLLIKTLKADGFTCKNGEVALRRNVSFGVKRIASPAEIPGFIIHFR